MALGESKMYVSCPQNKEIKIVKRPLNLGNMPYMELLKIYMNKCWKVWFNALVRPLQSHNSTQMLKQIKSNCCCTIQNNL